MAFTDSKAVFLLLLSALALTCQGLSKDPPSPTATKIVQGIQNVTTQSSNLQIVVVSITNFNAAEKAPTVVQLFKNIIAKLVEGIARVERVQTGPLPDDEAVLVVQTLTTFVQVHQALLSVVIGKHGLLALVPFFEPITVVLEDLEAAIDTLAFGLIGLIPTQKPAADAQFGSLAVTLTQAINTYSSPFEASHVAQF